MLRSAALMTPLLLALAGSAAAPAFAEATGGLTPGDEILLTLRAKGYTIVEDERTWLGRQRVIAFKDGTRRELVFIPGTGEILRDYAVRGDQADTTSRTAGKLASPPNGVGVTVGAAPVAGSHPGLSVGDAVSLGSAADPSPQAMGMQE